MVGSARLGLALMGFGSGQKNPVKIGLEIYYLSSALHEPRAKRDGPY